MAQTHHVEKHFTGSEAVRDVVIGMADGLTVPFALAAGLSAFASTAIIITGGLAEIAAGSISMGLGGYLAARGDAEHYHTERRREAEEIETVPEIEAKEIEWMFKSYDVPPEDSAPVVNALRRSKEAWINFMMRFELGLEEPEPRRALMSAATIAVSYAVAGGVPLSPYVFIPKPQTALIFSVVVTLIALAIFGYVKGRLTGIAALRSAVQTMLIGGIAAGLAFSIARLVS